MRRIQAVVVALVGTAILVSSVSAAVVANETYDVSGATLEAVWDSIEANSPNPGGAPGYAGFELGVIRNDGDPEIDSSEDPSCSGGVRYYASITRTLTDWSIRTTITLPAWTNGYAAACAEVKAEWDRNLAALRTHEEGHDDVYETALTNANPLSSIVGTGSGCDQDTAIANATADLAGKYSAEGQRVTQAIQAASDQYDVDTGNGETQGAVLDTDIVCCGNSQIDPSPPEQCDPPAENSTQCTQSDHCVGLKWCIYPDGYGDCTSGCQCSYNYPDCFCTKTLCGATCVLDSDCTPGYRCSNCACVGPSGGIAELPGIAGRQTLTPETASTNHILFAIIAAGSSAGAVVLVSAAWYARNRRFG